MNQRQQRIGWLLAVIFLFGGIMAPLAHGGMHAADVGDGHASTDQTVEYHADKSDCQLCEITLVAASTEVDEGVSHFVRNGSGGFVASTFVVDLPLFQSRAPPAIR